MYTKKVVAARSVMSNAAEADTKEEETVIWSTWEELLLAFAVKRHGLKDWHTVAMELQNRHHRGGGGSLFTAQICKDRYRHLKRRFLGGGTGESDNNESSSSFHSEKDDDNDEGMGGSGDGGGRGGGEDDTLPWLEELRKLRVAELKQEVHRYDVSIRSLQIKVKTMEEERENSLRREDRNDDVRQQRPDLDDVVVKRERSENDKSDDVDKYVPPEQAAGRSASGSAGNENASFNESSHYSTGNMRASSKTEPENELAEVKSDPEMMPPASGGAGGREDSCNDSSDRHQVKKAVSQEKEKDDGEDGSGEFRGSVDESKEATKESSDVQSSASLLTSGRKRRKRTEAEGGGGFVAAPIKRVVGAVKSEPSGVFSLLVDKIRSHKRGSVFQRRLESQKTEKYKRTIRRHVDLETIQTRIDEGSYFSCSVKFYLDLLLLFTNAIIFFPKASPESLAAQELRRLVMNEMKNSSDHRPNKLQLKADRGRSDPLLAKHQFTNPVRKRISISVKASPSSSNKVEKQKTEEDRPVTSSKPLAKSPPLSTSNDEEHSEKLKVREKPVAGTRNVRRSIKGGTVIKKPESTPNSSSNNKSSSSHQRGTKDKGKAGKVDKKKSAAAAAAAPTKKSGAADFLRRMKKNSPVKAMKSSKDNSKGRKKDQEKKKLGETKEAAGTRNAGGGAGKGGRRNAKEESSPSKRTTIGRLLKKVNDVTVTGSKRGRDGVGGGSSQRAKKRSR